jgi:succinate dehydrogenase/fumarate reductase flavoprotein subunit
MEGNCFYIWRNIMNAIMDFVKGIFVASADSIKNHLNGKELLQTLVAGLVAGGGVVGVLSALKNGLGSFVTDSTWVDTLQKQIQYYQDKNWLALAGSVATVLIVGLNKYLAGKSVADYMKSGWLGKK